MWKGVTDCLLSFSKIDQIYNRLAPRPLADRGEGGGVLRKLGFLISVQILKFPFGSWRKLVKIIGRRPHFGG